MVLDHFLWSVGYGLVGLKKPNFSITHYITGPSWRSILQYEQNFQNSIFPNEGLIFPNVTSLILCKFRLFSQFAYRFKIGNFECWSQETVNFFDNLQKDWKSGYLNVAVSWILEICQFIVRNFPRDRNLGFSNVGQ